MTPMGLGMRVVDIMDWLIDWVDDDDDNDDDDYDEDEEAID